MEKSGNSLYPLKSQGKVREFSEKSGKCLEISVKSSLFFRYSKLKKKYRNIDTFQKFLSLRGYIPGKMFIKC